MPVVNRKQYEEMIDNAKEKGYAYPAVNVTSTNTINAVLAAFANKKSDGIIQVSTGGGKFASGSLGSMALGAQALAEFTHFAAKHYDVNIVLHTDHCVHDVLDDFVRPLVEVTKKRRQQNLPNLFSSHMFDGSTIALEENLKVSKQLLDQFNELDMLLEIEIGAVGGEEDGITAKSDDKLYTSNEDMIRVAEVMGLGEKGRYLLAATFGNVHGVYKPGHVQLKPEILRDGQEAVAKKFPQAKKQNPFDFVFHGGSGSELEKIHQSLGYGVVKMNVDTDTQYAFTRPIVHHMMTHYDGVLKIDGEMGNKKCYDPRTYLKKAEQSMQERAEKACDDLKSSGKTLFKKKF